MLCMEYSTLWLSKSYFCRFESRIILDIKLVCSVHRVICSWGLCFCRCFLTGFEHVFDHGCRLPSNDVAIFFYLCFSFRIFIAAKRPLVSFFGFLRIAGTWIDTCVYFFLAVNIMISWFILTLKLSARLHNLRHWVCSDWKTLENQSANLQTLRLTVTHM